MITGQNTIVFALTSIMKQWETFITKKIVLGHLKTHKAHKTAVLGHMRSLFPLIDDSFDNLKGRDCYNNVVGALQPHGLLTSCKEIYTEKEAKFLASRGQRTDDIHII